MVTLAKKPRLVYFAPRYEGVIVANNLEVIVYRVDTWLREFFDVVQISRDCDFAQVVDKYKPELVLFDGFIEGTYNQLKFKISNLSSNRSIPRAGFCRIDSLSPGRGPMVSYLDECGAEAIFVLGDTSMGEGFREIADRLIYVPQYINPEVFKDYGQAKTIPLLMAGNFSSHQYPWRMAVRAPLMSRFPYLLLRHPGYNIESSKDSAIVIWGEQFARTLNASMVVPTSAGFKNIVVSKQIEIPAAKACLVTDHTPTLEAYGFRDMENCVFSDAHEAADKIDLLFRNRTILEKITEQGFHFAHECHSLRQRPQLFQWLTLKKSQNSNQKIVQPELFGDLQLVDKNSPVETLHLETATDLALVRQGDSMLWQGKLSEAEMCYLQVLKFCHYVSEPGLRLAIIRLQQGRADKAIGELQKLLQYYIHSHLQYTDPVEWAYFLFSLLCIGELEQLESALTMIPDVHREELDCARWLIYTALDDRARAQSALFHIRNCRQRAFTVHELPRWTFEEQVAIFCKALESSKLNLFRDRVRKTLGDAQRDIFKPADSLIGPSDVRV